MNDITMLNDVQGVFAGNSNKWGENKKMVSLSLSIYIYLYISISLSISWSILKLGLYFELSVL